MAEVKLVSRYGFVCKDGRPAPLTEAEVDAVMKAVAEFKQWYNNRPRY